MPCNLKSKGFVGKTPVYFLSQFENRVQVRTRLVSHQTCSPCGNGEIYLGHRHKNIEVQKNTDINSLETRPKFSSTCLNLSFFNLTQLLVLLTQEHLPHLPHNCSGNSCVSNNTWLKQKRSCLRIWPESLKNAVCTILTISEERFHQKLHIKHSSGFKANIFTRLDSLTNKILGLDARTYLPRTAGLSLKNLPAATTHLCVTT